ncbi:hypothetical protein [Antarctobacter heliothermus]|uniref:Uncharacterized protein n=1 Tax=Antarctobacter heliothermus TaxID=74033 RepID=A0A239H2R3_9RHOB|nr:hypothetical protein [Antarctobacter heliothermus]SNS74544.1 hypothetical protein SAMN04488078_10301 [Antarctobacter heliothermus]SNT18237.1 hypothetical protein SAMN04488078_106621 [Antarctobacter heliothermus]
MTTLIARNTILSAALAVVLASPARLVAQQITVTAAPEVSALMAACTPTTAQGAAIRDGLVARGWAEVPEDKRRAALAAFSAAHMWSFLPNYLSADRVANFEPLTDAVESAANGADAAFLASGDQYALILWNGDNLSCIWAGQQSDSIDTLAVQLGGFPHSDRVTTRAIDQRLEEQGRSWTRRMSVGRTPVPDLPPSVAETGLTDAARLDRSPL